MADPFTEIVGNALANWAPGTFGDPTENLRRRDAIFQDIVNQQRQGIPLKDQPYDAKQLEALVGPDRAAGIFGYEKTDDFAQRQQHYQNYVLPKLQLTDAVSGALAHQLQYHIPGADVFEGGAPAVAGAALMSPANGLPGAAPGVIQSEDGPLDSNGVPLRLLADQRYGMSDAEPPRFAPGQVRAGMQALPLSAGVPGVASAALQAPTNEPTQPVSEPELIRRTQALGPYLTSLVLGEEPGKAKQAEVTGQLAAAKLPIEQQEADARTKAAALGAQELNQRASQFGQSLMNDALKDVRANHPDLSPVEQRKVAKYFYDTMRGQEPDEAALGDLANRPGVVRSAGGGEITPRQTYKDLNDALARTPAFVKETNASAKAANFDQQTLDAQANADFRDVVAKAAMHLQTVGKPVTFENVIGLLQDRVTFPKKLSASKLGAVTWDGLSHEEKDAKYGIIQQILRLPVTTNGTAGSPRVATLTDELSNRRVGAPEEPSNFAARGAVPAATPGITAPQLRGYNYEPPIPIPRGQ